MFRILMAGALGLAVLSGCTQAEKAQVQQSVQGARQELQQGMTQAQRAAADQTLEAKVKQVLISRKGLQAGNIDVEAKAGMVTLRGDVADPNQARLAEQAAMEVEGVTGVINQLTMRIPATGNPPGPASHPAQGM